MYQRFSREQDLALEAGTLGCSHCRGMTPKARNVLRADDSVLADECARELPPPVKGAQTHTLGDSRGFPNTVKK